MSLVLLALGCGVRSVLKTGSSGVCERAQIALSRDTILDRYLDMAWVGKY